MRKLLLLLPLLLCACESEEEKRTKWIANCAQNEFSIKQCGVLYSIAKSSSDASDNAAAANIMSGAAVGMSAGRR